MMEMSQDSALKSHLYNVTEGQPNIDNFHHFYFYVLLKQCATPPPVKWSHPLHWAALLAHTALHYWHTAHCTISILHTAHTTLLAHCTLYYWHTRHTAHTGPHYWHTLHYGNTPHTALLAHFGRSGRVTRTPIHHRLTP